MFFNSWELWEKMTFVSDESSCPSIDQLANDLQVLGVCILIVFGIGYGKLLWRNRLARRQEVVDEEKRVKIQQLRNSGQIIETPKAHDIPFGVRAIQNGIEVDGIWISQTNTPIPSELRSGTLRGSTSGSSTEPQSPTQATPKILRAVSIVGEAVTQSDESSSSLLEHADDTLRADSHSNRKSYQPRKSSHLRYDNYGYYDTQMLIASRFLLSPWHARDQTHSRLQWKNPYLTDLQTLKPFESQVGSTARKLSLLPLMPESYM